MSWAEQPRLKIEVRREQCQACDRTLLGVTLAPVRGDLHVCGQCLVAMIRAILFGAKPPGAGRPS